MGDLRTLTVFVHPVNVLAHPTVPPGWWRWAVHLGADPRDLNACCQAWGEESRALAEMAASSHAVAIVNAFRLVGVPISLGPTVVLDADPIAAGADILRVGG